MQNDDVPRAADPLAPRSTAPKQRFPTWKQAFVLLGGGLALAVSACFGCLFSLDFGGRGRNQAHEALSILLGILSVVGLLAILVGGVLLFMRILRALFGPGEPPASPPSPPPVLPPQEPPQDRMPS